MFLINIRKKLFNAGLPGSYPQTIAHSINFALLIYEKYRCASSTWLASARSIHIQLRFAAS
jgi:hypothetical protein